MQGTQDSQNNLEKVGNLHYLISKLIIKRKSSTQYRICIKIEKRSIDQQIQIYMVNRFFFFLTKTSKQFMRRKDNLFNKGSGTVKQPYLMNSNPNLTPDTKIKSVWAAVNAKADTIKTQMKTKEKTFGKLVRQGFITYTPKS